MHLKNCITTEVGEFIGTYVSSSVMKDIALISTLLGTLLVAGETIKYMVHDKNYSPSTTVPHDQRLLAPELPPELPYR